MQHALKTRSSKCRTAVSPHSAFLALPPDIRALIYTECLADPIDDPSEDYVDWP